MSRPRTSRCPHAVTLLAALLVSAVLIAAPGDVDLSFLNPHVAGSILDHVVQPDGKIVIGGTFTSVAGSSRISLARLNGDGTHDTTFTSPFLSDVNSRVVALALQADGRLVVGGLFRLAGGLVNLVRVNADGSLDSTFAAPGVFGLVSDLFVQSNATILCISQSNAGVSLLNADGSFSEAIGTFITQASAFVVQADGKVVIGGPHPSGGSDTIMRFVPNGTNLDDFDLSFNNGNVMAISTDRSIGALALLPDDSILAAGSFSSIDGITTRNRLVHLNANGTIDDTFSAGAVGGLGILDIAVQPDGKIVAGGYFIPPGETESRGYARFNGDGSIDSSFSVDLPDRNVTQFVRSVGVQADGRILVAGDFTTIGSIARTFIARLLTDGSNAAPILSNVSVTSPISEHGVATLSGAIADADSGDTFSVTVDWGDGSAPEGFTYPAGTTSFSETHRYLDDDPTTTTFDIYAIDVTLADSSAATDTASTSVRVDNAAPTLSPVTATPSAITVGASTTVAGSVSDVGTLDSHTIVINWGDGSSNTTLSLGAGVSPFSATHQYTASGSFTIGVTVSDDDSGTASGSVGIVVSPPVLTPNPPADLTAVPISKTRIDLAWTDMSNNETTFRIERCNKGKSCTNFVEIGTTGANVPTFADTTVSANTLYRYRVRAQNGDGSSAYSNIASAKTPRR